MKLAISETTALPPYVALDSMFDITESDRFITALGLNPEQVVFQRFPVREIDSESFAQTLVGSIKALENWVKNSNLDWKCTVAISINQSIGPKQSEVKQVITVFADDDIKRDSSRSDWATQPHIITETSPGKYHYFWSIEPDCITPKELGWLQSLIAKKYGTDESLSDYAKKARLPGTVHRKGVPFMTRIVAINSHARYRREQLLEAFGDFTHAPAKPKQLGHGSNVTSITQTKGRNDLLMRYLSSARGKGATEEELMELAQQRNSEFDSPLDYREVNSIVHSVFSRYEPNPIGYELSELGNAERFTAQHKGCVGFNYTTNQWFLFENGVWRPDISGLIERLAAKTVRSIILEAGAIETAKTRNETIAWAKKSESIKVIKAMIELAKSMLHLNHDLFDADIWCLNLHNGYLNLKTGELLPHHPEQYLTKMAGCGYEKLATAPKWEKFIDDFTCGNKELASYLQRQIGRYLSGDVNEQSLLLFFGCGSNGKGVLSKLLQKLLGDYSVILQPDFFLAGAKNVELETLELRGARLALCPELPESGKIAEGRVKTLTGGDTVKGRALYQNFQTFEPTAKFALFSNHKPYITSAGNAIWRRLRPFPCDLIVATETANKNLVNELIAELPGILNWALEGLKQWLSDSGELPERIATEVKSYREAEDSLGAFLEDTCHFHNDFKVLKSDLYRRYKDWATEAGDFVMSNRALTKKLNERGIGEYRLGSMRMYSGIDLRRNNDTNDTNSVFCKTLL